MSISHRLVRPTLAFVGILIALLLPFTIINGLLTLVGDTPTYLAFLSDIILLALLIKIDPATAITVLAWFGLPTLAGKIGERISAKPGQPMRTISVAAAAADIHCRHGNDLLAGQMADRALAEWDRLVDRSTARREYAKCCNVKGSLLMAAGKYQEAFDVFYAPLRAGLDTPDATAAQCLECVAAALELGKFDRAGEYLEHVRELKPLSESTQVSFLTCLALLNGETEKFDEAVAAAEDAVAASKLPINRALAFSIVGLVQMGHGDIEGAQQSLRAAQRAAENVVDSPSSLRGVQIRLMQIEARIKFAEGLTRDATEILTRATQQGSVAPSAMNDLWQMYHELGDFDKASEWRHEMWVQAPQSHMTQAINRGAVPMPTAPRPEIAVRPQMVALAE